MKVKVTSENPLKPSRYLLADSPARCFLPGCQKPFDQSCFRSDDNYYYCSKECADIGRNADLLKVRELTRKTA